MPSGTGASLILGSSKLYPDEQQVLPTCSAPSGSRKKSCSIAAEQGFEKICMKL